MELDSEQSNPYPEDDNSDTNSMYSLTIECESSPGTLYSPIRISNEWISDQIEKPTDVSDANVTIDNILDNSPSIDWQDPKPTYLEPTTSTNESMDLSSAPGRLPNIRFVAKFNPPLVVPLAVHMQLHQSVGIEERPEDFRPTTFVGLALRPGEIDPGMMGAAESTHEIRSTRSVLTISNDGQQTQQTHAMSLYLPKIEYSRTLESLPFSHPKQLVAILPILRQYAITTSLLRSSFFQKPQKINPFNPVLPPPTPAPSNALQIDVNLTYTPPAPRLTIYIPHPSSSSTSSTTATFKSNTNLNSISTLLSNLLSDPSTTPPLAVTLDIHANAELVVRDQNVLPAASDEDMDVAEQADRRVKRLARALDVCGDLGIWGEWLRREVGRG